MIAFALLQPFILKRADCRVCGHEGQNAHLPVREMMYGKREVFEYFQCGQCACLQIASIPENLGSYYSDNYYSLATDHSAHYRKPLKNTLNRLRDQLTLLTPIGNNLPFKVSVPHLAASFSALQRVQGLSLTTRLLDVGCGSGQLLHRLANAGFRSLTGIDPFIKETQVFDDRLKILKEDLEIHIGQYDLILLNHAFEHMRDPIGAARRVKDLLAPEGVVVLRIPTVDSAAWKMYGADWFQIDAPRHLYLHSQKSIHLVAAQSGMTVTSVHFDSDRHQFQMSERFRADLPTILPPQDRWKLQSLGVTTRQVKAWARMAAALNALGMGDQACFYLRRSTA